MVYINHIYANVTASDDSQANVYAVVLPTDITMDNSILTNYIANNVNSSPEQKGVYRLTQNGQHEGAGIPPGLVSTQVHRNLFKYYINIAEGSAERLAYQTDYNVAFVAIDEYNNKSSIQYSETGNIVERAAPEQGSPNTMVNVSTDFALSNIETDFSMSSDLYFEYHAAVFDNQPVDDATIRNFLRDNAATNVNVVYGNVTTGFDGLLVQAVMTGDHVFTRAFSDPTDATRYDFVADKTSNRYLCVLMKNLDPNNEHTSERFVVSTIAPELIAERQNYTLSLPITEVFNRSANITFSFGPGNSLANTTVFYKAFVNVDVQDMTSGAFKDDLFNVPPEYSFNPTISSDTILRIYHYWDTTDSQYKPMVFEGEYRVYARVRNNVTGEMSEVVRSDVIITGKEPLLQGIINQTRPRENPRIVDFSGTIVVDQSNVDIYIGVTSSAYDDANVIKHLTANTSLDTTTDNYGISDIPKDGVLKFTAQQPVNGIITLPTSVADRYYPDIVINETTLISGLGGQNVYMYVVDENQRGNVFHATLANVDGYTANDIVATINLVDTFNRSFLVNTPNANVDQSKVHYIMAFSNTDLPNNEFWTQSELFTVFTGNADVSNYGETNVSIGTYFDASITTETPIAAGNTYDIYTVALDTINQQVYVNEDGTSVLRGLIAARAPVISNFEVNFNT